MKTGTTEAEIRALMEEWTDAVRTKDMETRKAALDLKP